MKAGRWRRGWRAVSRGEALVLVVAVLFGVTGIGWGLPCSDAWAADAISPRACGLGALVESYWPGHFHQYPPLHLLLLTLLSLPWIALGALGAGEGRGALEQALIAPGVMTPIELSARLVAVGMFAGVALHAMRLWRRLLDASLAATAAAVPEERRRRLASVGGWLAGGVVVSNPTLVYYAHTGNLEVPYLFWSFWALSEFDRVLAGEARERPALLAMAAAALTKDQAAGMFALAVPALLLAFPEVLRRRRFWRAAAEALAFYAVVSGALSNPRGFARRCALLLGPASADWAQYPKGWGGRLLLLHDALFATPRYGSWGLGLLAVLGLLTVSVTVAKSPARAAVRALLPLAAALSFTLLFTFGARRTEDRFLLPQSLLLMPYAAAPVLLLARGSRRRLEAWLLVCGGAAAEGPALVQVGAMLGTLGADARYEAERLLASLPAGTRVEAYGGPHFLPRFPAALAVSRVGLDDPEARSHLPGLAEVHASPNAIEDRRPGYVVLSTEFSHEGGDHAAVPAVYGVKSYADVDSARFFARLTRGELPYERVLRATCRLPFALACRRVHGSTGEEVWIYRRRTGE